MGVGRRAFLASSLASVAAPAVVRLARGEAPHVTLKLHHAQSSVSCVHTNFLAPWARKIEAQSSGRIRIDIFPSMALGGRPAELFNQARDRVADIVWAMPSDTPGRFPRIETFELPFVPSRRALVSSKAIDDFAAEFLRDEFGEVHPLCFSCSDRGILHTARPIEMRSALDGLRLDVPTRFAGAAVETLGGRAVPMPSSQLPFAIANRVVDGCIIPWNMVPALKLDELFKVHTDFADYSPSTTTSVLAMNKTAYAELPADLKKIIADNSGQLAAGMAGTMWDLKAKAVADAVSQGGDVIVTFEPEAVAHWRKATEPVIEAWRKQMKALKIDGEKLLAGARTLIDKYVNLPEPQPPQQPAQPKAEAGPPAKSGGATAMQSPAGPKVSAATPGPHSAPAAPPAPRVHWWEFWKSAPAPASATASAAPAASPAPTHWWQFWKSASTPAPATASAAPAVPHAPSPAAPPAPAATPVVPKPAPVAVSPPPAAAIVKPAPVAPSAPSSKGLNIPL
jgi:TRAP-type transport system periplasmic protein